MTSTLTGVARHVGVSVEKGQSRFWRSTRSYTCFVGLVTGHLTHRPMRADIAWEELRLVFLPNLANFAVRRLAADHVRSLTDHQVCVGLPIVIKSHAHTPTHVVSVL